MAGEMSELWVGLPHAAQIEHVIERANRLTDAEKEAIDRALDRQFERTPGGILGRFTAAISAMRAMARAHGSDWRSMNAASLSVPVQARDVVLAVIGHDQVGRLGGWDQEAYDLLLAPWTEVIGPVGYPATDDRAAFDEFDDALGVMMVALFGEYPATVEQAREGLCRLKKFTTLALLADIAGVLR